MGIPQTHAPAIFLIIVFILRRFRQSTLIRYVCVFVLIHFQEPFKSKTLSVWVWKEGLNTSKCVRKRISLDETLRHWPRANNTTLILSTYRTWIHQEFVMLWRRKLILRVFPQQLVFLRKMVKQDIKITMQARLARIRWYIARIFQTWSTPAEWLWRFSRGDLGQ